MINPETFPELPILKPHDNAADYDLDFGIDVHQEQMSIEQFMRQDTFLFNDPLQRNEAWSSNKRSLLISSLLMKVDIGKIKVQVIRKNKKKYRNVFDGKQRLTTIRSYVKDQWAIDVGTYILDSNDDGLVLIDISGLTFSELPQAYQDRILATTINIECYEIDDDRIKADLFYRCNNGEPLNADEKRKAKMPLDLLVKISELMQMDVFQAGMSPNSLKREKHMGTVLQSMAVILTDNNTALSGNAIDQLIDERKFDDALIEQTKDAAEYLNQVYQQIEDKKTRRMIFSKTKTVSLIYIVNKLLTSGNKMSPEKFKEWCIKFFVEDYETSGYTASSGTAKLDRVKTRNNIALKHFEEYAS